MRVSVLALLVLAFASLANADGLELKKGDHICIVGGTLAERMQHYGWLETLIHARFPEHELVFRNLGYSITGMYPIARKLDGLQIIEFEIGRAHV